MKQVGVMCCLFVLMSAFCLLVPNGMYAFDINTTVTNEGDLSVDMSVAGSGAPDGVGRLDRYLFELDSSDGTSAVTNTFIPETGQTRASIGYMALPNTGLLGGKLSADEEIGVNSCNSEAGCFGAANSSFEVEELTSESRGNFNDRSYAINASGRTATLGGSFGVGVAETVATGDPSVYERNIYRLKGEGVFSISGEYGFGCGDLAAVASNPFAGLGGGINSPNDGTTPPTGGG